jgi:hypothetical protein
LFTLALTPKDKDASTTTTKKKKKIKAPAYYTIDEVVTEVMSSLKAASNTTTTKTTTTKAASPTMSSLDIPPSVSKQKKKKKKTLPVKWQKLRASFKWVRLVGLFFFKYCLLCQLINLLYALARDLLPFYIHEQIIKRLSFKDCLFIFLTTSGLSIQ